MAREGIELLTRGFSGSGRVFVHVRSNAAEFAEVTPRPRLNLLVAADSILDAPHNFLRQGF